MEDQTQVEEKGSGAAGIVGGVVGAGAGGALAFNAVANDTVKKAAAGAEGSNKDLVSAIKKVFRKDTKLKAQHDTVTALSGEGVQEGINKAVFTKSTVKDATGFNVELTSKPVAKEVKEAAKETAKDTAKDTAKKAAPKAAAKPAAKAAPKAAPKAAAPKVEPVTIKLENVTEKLPNPVKDIKASKTITKAEELKEVGGWVKKVTKNNEKAVVKGLREAEGIKGIPTMLGHMSTGGKLKVVGLAVAGATGLALASNALFGGHAKQVESSRTPDQAPARG